MKTKILIIDDEEAILNNFKMIKFGENIEMVFCSSAKEAVLVMPTVDGIISDVQMPDQNVLEEGLKKLDQSIIYRMTGNVNYEFDKILLKPFSLKQFKQAITHLVELHQQRISKVA